MKTQIVQKLKTMGNKINLHRDNRGLLASFLIIFSLFGISERVHSQYCNTDGCNCGGTKNTSQYPSYTLTPTSSWNVISCQEAGEYSEYNVCSGVTYQWTYCPYVYSGASAGNVRIVLFRGSTLIQCEDGGANAGTGTCDGNPCIEWTSNFTGTVEIHTYRWNGALDPCNRTSAGCNSLAYRAVSGPTPSTPNSPNSNSPNCGDVTITRSGSPPSCVEWCWQTSSNGTSTSNCGSSYTVNSSGTYYLRAHHTQTNQWSSSTSISVTVKTNSTAPTDASANPSSLCSGGGCVTLTKIGGSLGTGASWEWYSGSCGGTSVGSGTSITVCPSSTTRYYVRAEGDCNTTSCAQQQITVSNTVTPSVSITASKTNICAGEPVVFTAQPTNGGNSPSYQWKKNGSNICSNSPTCTTSSLSNGDQMWCVMTSNANCANPTTAQSNPITITVNSAPSAPNQPSGPPSVCIGATSNYSTSPVSGADSYSWTVPSGWNINSGQGNTFINVTAGSASGEICVAANNDCGQSSESCLPVSLSGNGSAPDSPGNISGPDFISPGTSQTYSISSVAGANSYSWSVPTGWSINSGQGSTSITVTVGNNPGDVCVYASNNCGDSQKSCKYITGIKEITSIRNLTLSPNPTPGMFTLSMELTQPEPLQLRILNIIGQVMHQEKLGTVSGSYQKTIDLSRHAKGVYLLQLAGKEGVMSRKVVVH